MRLGTAPRVCALSLNLALIVVVGCSGESASDAGTNSDAGSGLADGGPRDAGSRDAGGRDAGPYCGDGVCAPTESYLTCVVDCRGGHRCVDGAEGCPCHSSFTAGDAALARDDCIDADNLCVPWDTLSERGTENMRPSQSCVKTCVDDVDCGMNDDGSARRCVAIDDDGASPPIGSICVDRLAELDAYCGGSRNTAVNVTNDGAVAHTLEDMVGCGPQATCWFGSGSALALNPDEGVCVQLCGAERPPCPSALPYCNPRFAEVMTATGAVALGVCSSAKRGVGAWCGSEDVERGGLSERCDRSDDTVGDVRCVDVGVPLGLCIELCDPNANPPVGCQTVDDTQGPLACSGVRLGDRYVGVCLHASCDDSPDTCDGAGTEGHGRFCMAIGDASAGLCADRLAPTSMPGTIDTTTQTITNGDDCRAEEMGFARCPDPTRCVTTSQAGEGSCLVGCATDDPTYCDGVLMDLGVGTTNATCAAVFPDTSIGLCAGDS